MKAIAHKTNNRLPEKIRAKMIDLLNQELADVLDLGLQAKQAHWNVKGLHFIGLHELFDKVAEEVEGFTEVSRGVDKLLWFVEAHAQATDRS